MANRVKIVGYAKKEFFSNGIEYRNFSPDLVGNQFTNNEGTPIFTSGNFNITTNLDGKVDKNFVTNEFSEFISLQSLNLDDNLESIITKYSKNAKLNLDYSNPLTYAFFGSLREYIRVSLENIIIKWPASLYIREVNPTDNTLTGDTVIDYTYNSVDNSSVFTIDTNRIQNNFNINFLSGGTIENTFNETNNLRNLVINYNSYVISNSYGEFQITNLIGASELTNSTLTLTVTGNPFPNFGSENINYHIKPNDSKIEEFFFKLNEFENNLLNRLTIPKYTSTLKVYNESETGDVIESIKKLTWPVSDGYNIDFNSISYANYVTQLLNIAETNDDYKSNLMVRFLVSTSISEFDSIPDIDGTYPDTNGQKMTSMLKIYGREFDEIKKYSDGIAFANVVTYDKKNNTPDVLIKNLSRILGWELTTSISQIDVLSNFLSLNSNYYDGYSRGFTDAEAEIELWRRIVLNTPWIWKSKGTRKAIEFLFKFIGAPDGLVTFNEHLYVANEPVDSALVIEMMDYFNNTTDISDLNLDSEGYPQILPNTPEMYFQKAGLWYRQTGGPTPDIDILYGNNPHIGPYDGGQEFINQFTSCLVPNFSGGTGEVLDIDAEVNLFTNYANGTFNECCDSNILVQLDTSHDFDNILTTNLNKIYDNNPVTESGCTINNSWTLIASLTGETFYENTFFSGSSAPTESDYVNELYNLSGTTNLSGVTFVYDSVNSIFNIISSNEDCDSDLLDTYFKIDLCVSSDFDCIDESISGLVAFNVSDKDYDACNATQAYPLIRTYYHNGDSVLPEVGDTVYSDSDGLTPVYHPSGFTPYMGGDFSLTTSWLQTNTNGVMEEIICPEIPCRVITGKFLSGELNNVRTFYIEGVSGTRNATVSYRIHDVTKTNPSSNIEVFIGENQTYLTETNSPLIDNILITPDAGSLYDYEVQLLLKVDAGVISYSVTMELLTIDDECIIGSTSQTFVINV